MSTVNLFTAIANLNRATAMTRLLNATIKQNIVHIENETYVGVSIAYNKDNQTLRIVRNGEQMEVSPNLVNQTDSPVYVLNVYVNEKSKSNAFSTTESVKQVVYKLEYDGENLKPLNRLTQFESIDLAQLNDHSAIDSACDKLMIKLRNNNELTDARKTAPTNSLQAELNRINAAKRAAKKASK